LVLYSFMKVFSRCKIGSSEATNKSDKNAPVCVASLNSGVGCCSYARKDFKIKSNLIDRENKIYLN